MNTRYCCTLIVILCAIVFAKAQQTDEKTAVLAVVNNLFKGMEKGDSALVHSTFSKDVTLATIFRDKAKKPILERESSIAEFLKAVGTPHPDVWYEEIWNVKVEIDGDLAQVWCDYAFYAGSRFSHCGVDAFHLHKGADDGWKIFHLSDTRRREGCAVPEEIKKKHP